MNVLSPFFSFFLFFLFFFFFFFSFFSSFSSKVVMCRLQLKKRGNIFFLGLFTRNDSGGKDVVQQSEQCQESLRFLRI